MENRSRVYAFACEREAIHKVRVFTQGVAQLVDCAHARNSRTPPSHVGDAMELHPVI